MARIPSGLTEPSSLLSLSQVSRIESRLLGIACSTTQERDFGTQQALTCRKASRFMSCVRRTRMAARARLWCSSAYQLGPYSSSSLNSSRKASATVFSARLPSVLPGSLSGLVEELRLNGAFSAIGTCGNEDPPSSLLIIDDVLTWPGRCERFDSTPCTFKGFCRLYEE